MINIVTLLLVFIVIVFSPDFFIPCVLEKLKSPLGEIVENNNWKFYSKIIGWIERCLYGIFFLFLETQFIAFVGIWLALKVIGSFNTWEPLLNKPDLIVTEVMHIPGNEKLSLEHHKRRARQMIFTIGTGLSLLWVIIVSLLAKSFVLSF